MRVVFVRHGESVANCTGHWQGQGDSPLSDRGRTQASALGEYLEPRSFDRVISSDLQRAHHTALAVHPAVDAQEVWREVNLGAWEGLTREEVAERFPEEIAGLRRGEPVKIGGGESWVDVHRRVGSALERLRAEAADDSTFLVASHGGVISTVFADLLSLTDSRPRPMGWLINTSISEVEWNAGKPEIHSFNITPHLKDIGHKYDEFEKSCDLHIRVSPSAADAPHEGSGLESAVRGLLNENASGWHHLSTSHADLRQAAVNLLGLPAESMQRFCPLEPGHHTVMRFSEGRGFLQNWNAPDLQT